MAFLVFGLIGNPSAFLNFDNKIQHDSVKLNFASSSSAGLVFAQNEDDNADEDKTKNEDQTDDESKNEDHVKDKEKEGKIKIKVEIENGVAKIKTQVNDEKTEFEINETDKDVIIQEIALRTGLTIEEVKSVITFEEAENSEETEDGDVNNEDNQTNNEEQGNVNNEDDVVRESKSKQVAEERIAELEQKIAQLEQRLQTLLEKLDSGEYFGPVVGTEPLPKSYSISFDGSASSISDSQTTAVSGEIFMEPLGSIKDTAKFRVTGGEILVGDTSYDFVFGKARMTSSAQSSNNDSITIIGQIMSADGDVKTVRILLGSASPFEGDFGLEPINVEMMPQSKISNEWSLSASGTLSLL